MEVEEEAGPGHGEDPGPAAVTALETGGPALPLHHGEGEEGAEHKHGDLPALESTHHVTEDTELLHHVLNGQPRLGLHICRTLARLASSTLDSSLSLDRPS